MRATGTNWRIDGGRARGTEMVPGGSAGIRSASGNVHLEVAGGFAAGVGGLSRGDGTERDTTPRYAEDTGMAGGQFMGSDAEGDSLFCNCIAGRLRRGTFFGDAAPIAGPSARAAALCGVSGVLPAATGGVEFFFDEPVAGLL